MPQRRRLEDFYVIGKQVTFDDGQGEPLTVWLRKLNPVENASSVRKAAAARARLRSARKDPDSDEYQALMLDVYDLGDEAPQLVEYIIMDKIAEATLRAEARTAAEDEWSDDDYLQGLRDAWMEGLRDTYAENPEDPEAKRVLDELKRFDTETRALADADIEDAKAEYGGWSLEQLREKALEIQFQVRGSGAWLDEFHRCEIFFGTFDEDRKTRYFAKREEVDGLSEPVLTRLLTEYADLSVDVLEGKDSEETHDSSTSSEQPDEVETGDSSGLVAVTP